MWDKNFDKIALLSLICFFVLVEWHASHDQADVNSGFSQFLQQGATGAMGALLALMVKSPKADPPPAAGDKLTLTATHVEPPVTEKP